MRRFTTAIFAPLLGLALGVPSLTACSSGPKAFIPVDSPLRTWSAPEADAYTPDPAAAPSAPQKQPASGTPKRAVKRH